MDQEYRLDIDAERNIYDHHQNLPDDPRYREFVSALYTPLMKKMPAGAKGLEFGCGSGSALTAMLREAGFKVIEYDPYYQPGPDYQTHRYDFITATEVFEHLYRPGEVILHLCELLKSKATIGVMTALYDESLPFQDWYYVNDPTHVSFFSEASFEWIAASYNAKLEVIGSRVILLHFDHG